MLGLFCLLLVWAPLPLGSAREWSMAVLFVTVGVILFAWSAIAALNTSVMHPHQKALWPAIGLFSVGMMFATMQVVDLTQIDAGLGTHLAKDLAHPLWGMASESLGVTLPAYVSVDPFLSIAAIKKLVLYAGVFWLAFQLAQDKSGANAILWAVVLSGGVNAIVMVVESGAKIDVGSWLNGDPYGGQPRPNGTFVNPNHFATFASMSLVAAMALCIPLISEGIILNRGRDIARRTIVNTMTGPGFPLASAILGIAGVIALTGSRAGTFAMLVGSIVLALCLTRWGNASARSGSTVANWGIFGIITVGVAIAFAPLALRLSSMDDFSDRLQFAQDTLGAIAAAPVIGNGLGAFEYYFPLYATQSHTMVVNAAHNDYLEMLADLGVIGGGALILAAGYVTLLALQGVFRRRRRKHVCAAGVAAAAVCGFHAFFEFGLQIPAVGLTLFALLGAAVAQSWHSRTEVNDPRESA